MLFNKERISFKKIIASTLLFSFCNLSTSIAETVVAEDILKGTAIVDSTPVRLNNGTIITNSDAKINLSLRDSDVKQVLRMFANKAGLNIIFHSSVNGKVTLDLVDTNVNDAFELVLDTCELTYYKDGATIIIASKGADTKMTFSKRNLTSLPVKNVLAKDIAEFLNKNVYGANMIGLSNKEIATVNPMNNEVLIFGSESDVDAARKIIEKFDVKPIRTSYSLSHTTPKEMAELICSTYVDSLTGTSSGGAGAGAGLDPFGGGLGGGLGGGIGGGPVGFASGEGGEGEGGEGGGEGEGGASVSDIQLGGGVVACTIDNSMQGAKMPGFSKFKTTIAYFPQLGTIGVYGGSKYFSDLIGDFIKEHDVKQRMAYIEMSVLELTEAGSKEFSNSWGLATPFATFNFDPTTGSFTSSTMEVFNDKNSSNNKWLVSNGGGTNLTYSLKMLLENGNARTITNPKLMMTNGQKVVLDMTQDYVESVDVEFSESTVSSQPIREVTYNIGDDLGLKIQIVPFISDSGYVSLNVTPEFSTIADEFKDKDEADNEYVAATLLQRRNIELKNLRVKDGETLVIAGLITEDETQNTKKVPILGDLPLVGFLFRASSTQKTKSELVIMVTPHIIYDKEDKKVENI